jgi:selenocysteine-specific elongation factor
MVLAAPGALTVTQSCDAEIEVLSDAPAPVRSRQRVRVHTGTAEVLGRVTVLNEDQRIEPGSTGFAQLRLESPVAAAHADRFIIRSYSPQRTIAGGRMLDVAAPRHRRADLEKVITALAQLSEASDGGGNLVAIVTGMAGPKGIRTADVRSRTGLRQAELTRLIDEAVRSEKVVAVDGVLISGDLFDQLRSATLDAVGAHHRGDKLARGMPRETLREKIFKHAEPELFRSVTNSLERDGKIVFDQDVFKLASHETKLSTAEADAHARLRKTFSAAGLEVPKLDDALSDAGAASGLDARSTRKVFQLLVNDGEVVAVTPEFYFSSDALTALTTRLREFARTSGDPTIDVSKFKEIAGVSRKYAIPLLEYFDRMRVTRRVGDKRQVM